MSGNVANSICCGCPSLFLTGIVIWACWTAGLYSLSPGWVIEKTISDFLSVHKVPRFHWIRNVTESTKTAGPVIICKTGDFPAWPIDAPTGKSVQLESRGLSPGTVSRKTGVNWNVIPSSCGIKAGWTCKWVFCWDTVFRDWYAKVASIISRSKNQKACAGSPLNWFTGAGIQEGFSFFFHRSINHPSFVGSTCP